VIFKDGTQCKGKSVTEIYDICESGLIYGRLGGNQKFFRGFQGCQEKQQMEQQNGNLVENEEEERCFLAQ
jgi:hypothetical protein